MEHRKSPFGFSREEIADAYELAKTRPEDVTHGEAFALILETAVAMKEHHGGLRAMPLARAFVRLREGSELALEVLGEAVEIIEAETRYDSSGVRKSIREIARLCGSAYGEN